jgi:hypothetical protein
MVAMKVNRSIYEILLQASAPGNEITLSCDECFILMEYLADLNGVALSPDAIKKALLKHFDHCPGCYQHHLKRLNELTEKWNQIQHIQ